MIKKFFLLLFAFLIFFSLSFGGSWHTFKIGKRSLPESPEIKLLSNSPENIAFSVGISGIWTDVKSTHKKLFSTISFPESGVTNKIGMPELPVIRKMVEIPYGATFQIKCFVKNEVEINLKGIDVNYKIFPVQYSIPKIPGAEKKVPFAINEKFYNSNNYYPFKNVTYTGPYYFRGHKTIMVEFYPVKYNPLKDTIKVITDADIEVNLLGGDWNKTDEYIASKVSPTIENWLSKNIINYRGFTNIKGTSNLEYSEGMLVVVGATFVGDSQLENYLNQRRAEGLKVVEVNMGDIGSTADDLRNYIRNQYLNWSNPPLTYVLLVGDTDTIPFKEGTADYNGDHARAADNYYAAIDPEPYSDDLLAPDVLVSRITVRTADELHTYLNKAIMYDNLSFSNTSWCEKIEFIATSDSNNYTTAEGTHNYVIDNYTTSAHEGYTGIFPNNPQDGGDKAYAVTYSATESTVVTCTNDGRFAINYSGHGGEYEWAGPEFTQDDVRNINTTDDFPFVIGNCCVANSFNYDECFGETWIRAPHGAILYFGASMYSYWDEDDILERRMWDGVFADGITILGKITDNAKHQLFVHYGDAANTRYYFEIYNMLGDCSLDLVNHTPTNLNCSYQNQVPVGVNSVDFHVEDSSGSPVENALVSLFNIDHNIHQVGYTDSSGNVTIQFTNPPADVMTLNVVITHHNNIKHTGTIDVIPASGPYLTHDAHIVLDYNSEAPALEVNPGNQYKLKVTLKNVGQDTASGINTTLTTNDTHVTIDQADSTYPDIAPNSSADNDTYFEFSVSSDAPDELSIPFVLNWSTTSKDHSGSTSFYVTVKRPILEYMSHSVDDSDGNCDTDGIPDENELSTITVTLKNNGTGTAVNPKFTLVQSKCDISNSPQTYNGSIDPGDSVQVSFDVVPGNTVECPETLNFEIDASYENVDNYGEVDSYNFDQLSNADIVADSFDDDMESGEGSWTHSAAQGTDDWGLVTDNYHSATHAWFASDVGSVKDDYLYMPDFTLGNSSTLTFWQKYDMESGYDGCVIEISTDGGSTWEDLGNYITQNGYTGTISSSYNSPIGGRSAWTGTADWEQVVVDLSHYASQTVKIRFRLACDSSANNTGWWIDDVHLDTQTTVCQQTTCSTVECSYGDLNRDGNVDTSDLILLAQYLSGQDVTLNCGANYADLNSDSSVNAIDLEILANYITGNITSLPYTP